MPRNPKFGALDPSSTDFDLVAAASRANTEPFAVLFDRHGETLFRYAWTLTRSIDEATSVVAEVFVVAWRKRYSMGFATGSALPWLLSACHMVAVDRAEPSDDDLASVYSAIAELSVPDQQLCWLTMNRGTSHAAAAIELGIPVSTVPRRASKRESAGAPPIASDSAVVATS